MNLIEKLRLLHEFNQIYNRRTTLLKNWKTTLAGIAAAVANTSVNGVSWKQLLVSAAFAALGFLAKDHSAKQ